MILWLSESAIVKRKKLNVKKKSFNWDWMEFDENWLSLFVVCLQNLSKYYWFCFSFQLLRKYFRKLECRQPKEIKLSIRDSFQCNIEMKFNNGQTVLSYSRPNRGIQQTENQCLLSIQKTETKWKKKKLNGT